MAYFSWTCNYWIINSHKSLGLDMTESDNGK